MFKEKFEPDDDMPDDITMAKIVYGNYYYWNSDL